MKKVPYFFPKNNSLFVQFGINCAVKNALYFFQRDQNCLQVSVGKKRGARNQDEGDPEGRGKLNPFGWKKNSTFIFCIFHSELDKKVAKREARADPIDQRQTVDKDTAMRHSATSTDF